MSREGAPFAAAGAAALTTTSPADVDLEQGIGIASTRNRSASSTDALVKRCARATADIERRENLVNLVTKTSYDGVLEVINEVSDVVLMIYLWHQWVKKGKAMAYGLFVASVPCSSSAWRWCCASSQVWCLT